MWLRTGCELTFEIETPTAFNLMLRPRSGAQQWVASEAYNIEPWQPVSETTDAYGNLVQRVIAPAGRFSIQTSAEVKIADAFDTAPGAPFVEIPHLPDTLLQFLLPSRYCESDRFGLMAGEITEGCLPGYDQVAIIVDWLREHIVFDPYCQEAILSAVEVNLRQVGVCRDLAQLGIALCRSLSIPARLVVGYMHGLEPMDLHAWFEAYVGGRWYTFDATQSRPLAGYVAVGYGRDAADVAIYNQFGPAVAPLHQEVRVEEIPSER